MKISNTILATLAMANANEGPGTYDLSYELINLA